MNGVLDLSSSMENSLLCPMQARTNDIRVEDVPTKLDNQSKQSIILDAENIIPIYYHGPIPYIHTRYPTDFDMNTYTGFELSANSS